MKSDTGKYLVWNPARNLPKRPHATIESAIAESERLAQANPGEEYYVMAPIGVSVVEAPKVFRQSPDWSYAPF